MTTYREKYEKKAIEEQNKSWATRTKKPMAKYNRNHPWLSLDRKAFAKREKREAI